MMVKDHTYDNQINGGKGELRVLVTSGQGNVLLPLIALYMSTCRQYQSSILRGFNFHCRS